ncbi:MAG: SpoIID/LytB domain-containing protein [Endomicrobia bacterium]|nr:SpoIID/LytB domain-containing protein [Endomicrobiia bacterium]
MRKIVFINIILTATFYTVSFSESILEIRKKYLDKKITDYYILLSYQSEDYRDIILKDLILFEYYLDKEEVEKAKYYGVYLSSFYPLNQLTNFRLGEFYFIKGDMEKAVSFFENCVRNDSRFHEARKSLAQSYLFLKNYSQAYKHFNIFSWFNPDKEILRKLDYLSNHIESSFVSSEKKFTEIKSLLNSLKTQDIPYINVGISTKDNGNLMRIDCVKFYASNDFVIIDERGKEIIKAKGGFENEWTVVYRSAPKIFGIISPTLNKEYRIKTKFLFIIPKISDASFYISEYKWFKNKFPQNKEFRGSLIIKNLKDQIIVINNLPLDEYLYSVVPKEIGKNTPTEALKAQAVIARTVALYRKKRRFHKHFDVCWGQHCQVYEGIKTEDDSSSYAVNTTLGEVITNKDGNLENIFFHANCGGITLSAGCFYSDDCVIYDAKESFNIDDFYKWYLFPLNLNCEPSDYVHPGTFRWLRVIKKDTLSRYLDGKYKIGKLKEILVISRRKNLYINKIKIIGTKRNKILLTEHEIRNIVPNGSLRSSSFIVEYNKNTQTYYFWGAGWGHGIGMCQSGSCNLANEGRNYVDIIKHYYPLNEVRKIY